MPSLEVLKNKIRKCIVCAEHLPYKPRPIFEAASKAKLIIIGQAPGIKVHQSGIAWQDASGDRLREWLGVSEEQFYNPEICAIIPMGFCYPGKGKSGDLPPRPECAPLWHDKLFHFLQQRKLTLLIGQYAQNYYLAKDKKKI